MYIHYRAPTTLLESPDCLVSPVVNVRRQESGVRRERLEVGSHESEGIYQTQETPAHFVLATPRFPAIN